ncbi:hypothetical protein SAMN05444370_103111 [Rubrimonas cliftonensis]|uniref:Oxidoreductase molybdopterin-binding domain-containing protein n=1 Tax=Rubrimonas cliftonensis TaxID=89524 RepID=A0A1H3YI80_9RHOB|nr:hypothetical protein SAMN05444370_103111 [Rubrimonas cliftonensis]
MSSAAPLSRRRVLLGASAAACLCGGGARAGAEETLLTLSGLVDRGAGSDVRFDAAGLRALDWREIVTYTIWTEGPQRLAGPTLASVLEAAGARGAWLDAVALNDYRVRIPASDAGLGVIVAMERAGERMAIRDKGPLWIIYPQTEAEAQIGAHNERMIWQLREIVVR